MIETRIDKNRISFKLDGSMNFLGNTKLYFDYPINVSKTPKHVANYMLGILLSEHFSWNDGTIMFDELTRKEVDSIRYHVRMNHFSDPYGRVSGDGVHVITEKLVEDDIPDGSGPVLASNGMGKDGLLTACLANEITKNIKPFTVGNQYTTTELWEERKETMAKFYKEFAMPEADYIMTNYVRSNDYKIIPWWVMGLPLAHAYEANTILAGCEISFSKTMMRKKLLLRPNISIFSFDNLRDTTGIFFSSPTHPVSACGSEMLLSHRYPESLKYQRSCMTGMPWCNQCGNCYVSSLYLRMGKINMKKIGLLSPKEFPKKIQNYRINPITQDTIDQMKRKDAGKFHDSWFEKANEYIFPLIWEGSKLRKIMSEHLELYNRNPSHDRMGYEYEPSKWGQWLKEGMV